MTSPRAVIARTVTLRVVLLAVPGLVPLAVPAAAQAQTAAAERGSGGVFAGGAARDSVLSARPTESRRRRGAAVVVSAATNHESNVRFLLPTPAFAGQPTGDTYHLVSAGVSGAVGTGRQQLQVDARGDLARFAVLRELDRETWDVGGQFTRRWTPRVSSLTGARTVTSTGVLGAGTASPGLLPLALTRTESAVQSLVVQSGVRTSITATVDGSRVRFDDRTLAGGSTVAAQLQTRTRRGARGSRALLLEARHVDFAAQPIGTVTSEVEWQQPVGRALWSLRLGATGVGRQPRRAGERWGDSMRVEPSGSLTIERVMGRQAVTLRAGRDVRAGFGFGRALLTDAAALGFTHSRPRGSSVTVAVDASQNVDPYDARLRLRFYGATAEWRRAIGPAAVAVTGFARRRTESVDVDNVGASLQMRFAVGRAP